MYRLDLRDVFRPAGGQSRLTWRRLGVLIRGLPATSRTATSRNNGVPVLSTTEALLYLVADFEQTAAWQRYAYARGEKDPKPGPPPRPLPRPGDVKTRVVLPEEKLLAFRERHRARNEGGAVDAG